MMRNNNDISARHQGPLGMLVPGSASGPQCPPILRKMLDVTSELRSREKSVYSNFLSAAEAAVSNSGKGGLVVTLGTRSVGPDVQDSAKSTSNSSLFLLFSFYAKLQNPNAQLRKNSPTYAEIEYANETLSFFELTLLCRDLNIVPKLATRDELILLWKLGNMEKANEEQPDTTSLKFEEFRPFLARLALVAYNKPGLKKIITSINGTMLSPLEQVNSLAYYLHLDDINRVKIHLDTVGKETASQLNSRSAGDKSGRTVSDLRNDLRGQRLAKLLSTEKKMQEKILTSSNTGTMSGPGVSTRSKTQDPIDEIYAEDSTHREAARKAERIAAVVERKRRLEAVLQASNLTSHTTLLPEVKQQIHDDVHHRIIDMINQVGFQFGKSFDESAFGMGASLGRNTIGAAAMTATASPPRSAAGNNPQKQATERRSSIKGQTGEHGDGTGDKASSSSSAGGGGGGVDLEEDSPEHNSAVGALAASTGIEISSSQEAALAEYTPALSEALRRFCVVDLVKTKADNKVALFDEFGGGFADIGAVLPGSQVTVRVKIINRGVHEMNIQVSTRSFVASSLSVIKMPHAIAPGMDQTAVIKFTAPLDYIGPCLAFISVNSISNPMNLLSREEYVVDCPVFYKVSHYQGTSAEHPIPDTTSRCTLRSLQALIAKERDDLQRSASASRLLKLQGGLR